jgi:hypothetical protein
MMCLIYYKPLERPHVVLIHLYLLACSLPPTHCSSRRLPLYLVTHTHTHTQTYVVGLLWTRDRPITETST